MNTSLRIKQIILFIGVASCLTIVWSVTESSTPEKDTYKGASWRILKTNGAMSARHESGFVNTAGNLHLLGGRGIKPVDTLEVDTLTWRSGARPPIELHHFQPVVFKNRILVIGALTGNFPDEKPVSHVYIYDPLADKWSQSHVIPENRRRGSTGVSIYQNLVYVTGGIRFGHRSGTVPWFDIYNPDTGEWTELRDMPNPRDHFQTAVLGGNLYAAGGRITQIQGLSDLFSAQDNVTRLNIYDFDSGTWSNEYSALPLGRAGASTVAIGTDIWVTGGESTEQLLAHSDTYIFDTVLKQWSPGPELSTGRHATGIAFLNETLWTASGAGTFGGLIELDTLESLTMSKGTVASPTTRPQ